MNKRGLVMLIISIVFIILLIGAIFLYFALFRSDNSSVYAGQNIKNPVEGLSDVQAIAAFDERFIFYLLYNIKAYNLHNPPLSSNYPKIEVNVNGEIFSASVIKGLINVSRNGIAEEDVIIKTTKEEAVRMMREKSYVMQSFKDKKSSIELVADKTTLFAKGYLSFYTEVTGKGITGSLIGVSFE